MIKIVAIHKLFEVALDALFNALSDNFTHHKLLKVGSRYKSIIIKRQYVDDIIDNKHYTNCVIMYVYEGKYMGSPTTIFDFTTGNGDLVMGCTLFDTIIS